MTGFRLLTLLLGGPLVSIGVVALLGHFRPLPVVLASILGEVFALALYAHWTRAVAARVLAGQETRHFLVYLPPGESDGRVVTGLMFLAFALLIAGAVLLGAHLWQRMLA